MKKEILLIGLIFVTIFSLGITSAQIIGCCFNPTNGLCSESTDMDLCAPFGGEFFENKMCPTVEKCQKGCCSLGSSSTFVSRRECQLLSNEYQFDFPANFQAITEQECTSNAQSASSEYGACVYKVDYPPYKCKYVAKASCTSRDFFPGVLCSDEELNTSCKVTKDKTMCFAKDGSNEDVYNQDSCGNPDKIKNDCNYKNGNSCATYRPGIDTKPAKGDLICRDLNCVDQNGDKIGNGQSKCINEDPNKVGSRSARKFCLNGNLITEPCEDFRMETCESGESETGDVRCVYNPWNECFTTNASSTTNGCGDSCYSLGKYSPYKNTTLLYLAEHEYGFNAVNVARTMVIDKWSTSWSYKEYNSSICSGSHTTTDVASPTKTGEICLPNNPAGLQFYNKQKASSSSESTSASSSSTSGTTEAKSICSKGSLEAKAYFHRVVSVESVKNTGGNIITLLASENLREYSLGTYNWNTMADEECWMDQFAQPLSMAFGLQSLVLTCKTDKRVCDDSSESGYDGCGYFNQCSWYNDLKIEPAPELLDYLNKKCKALGDCDGKLNIVDVSGQGNYSNSSAIVIPPYSDSKPVGDGWKLYLTGYDWVNGWHWKNFPTDGEKNGGFKPQKLSWISSHDSKIGSIRGVSTLDTWSRDWKGYYKLSFTCEPFVAPDTDKDCDKCDDAGIACSEYRCKALGKKCDFYEKEGIGYCTRSNDNTAPKITCTATGCPKTAIKPFTPFEFAITTDEAAECKFNFNFAGGKYSEMKYDFGKGFGIDHKVVLSLPGQNKQIMTNGSNATEYQLLKEGKGTLYVRCLDAAGNGQVSTPFLIPFEVMKTPDGNSPIILEANPKSGSKIIFNTTEKVVNFKLNEPSECNWDTKDVDYDKMSNFMTCDKEVSESATILGYFCSARFTNITTYIGAENKFFVRCKDQPYLEGNEDDLYKRNTNYKSTEYILRPSEKLEISSFAPKDIVKKGTENQSLEIIMTTKAGAANGKAECSWRNVLNTNSSGFVRFLITNSNSHKQPITRPVSGLNSFEIKCQDEVGNVVIQTFNFTLLIDENYPSVSRLFEATKNIKVKTDEDSKCYYSNNNVLACGFDINNATMMSGDKKEHTVAWANDKTFYIKCKDTFGNYNKDCGVIIKTY